MYASAIHIQLTYIKTALNEIMQLQLKYKIYKEIKNKGKIYIQTCFDKTMYQINPTTLTQHLGSLERQCKGFNFFDRFFKTVKIFFFYNFPGTIS